MTVAAVELAGVTKRFGEVAAVADMLLTVADAEFFSLLGPSGCGKTTTLRMIAGFEFPTVGSVRIYGEEMGLRPPNRRPVNTVFQSYALFPHMTVARNVAFGLEMTGVDGAEIDRRVAEALELVQLGGMAGRKPRQLSGGQQQRVALARALVNRPKVLLLDEPLGALDLKLRQAMQLELKDLQTRVGITFIYVTHDQEEALTMSDRIGVMNEGRLLQVGTPEEIYERPASRFVADFIGDTNMVSGTVAGPDTIELADGTVVKALTAAVLGSPITLTLRPERIYLFPPDHRPDGDTLNRHPGRVTRRVYYGDSFYYDVDMGVAVLEVRQENAPGVHRFEVGEQVAVVWDPSSSVALAE